MYVATTDSGTTYVVDDGNLYRLPAPDTAGPSGLIMRGVKFPLGWYDTRDRLSDRPYRGHRWEILGYDPDTAQPVRMTTTTVQFSTNTDEWARHVDEEPHTFCWDHLVTERLVPQPTDLIPSIAAHLWATDQVTHLSQYCCVCGS